MDTCTSRKIPDSTEFQLWAFLVDIYIYQLCYAHARFVSTLAAGLLPTWKTSRAWWPATESNYYTANSCQSTPQKYYFKLSPYKNVNIIFYKLIYTCKIGHLCFSPSFSRSSKVMYNSVLQSCSLWRCRVAYACPRLLASVTTLLWAGRCVVVKHSLSLRSSLCRSKLYHLMARLSTRPVHLCLALPVVVMVTAAIVVSISWVIHAQDTCSGEGERGRVE